MVQVAAEVGALPRKKIRELPEKMPERLSETAETVHLKGIVANSKKDFSG
jgi:hypothetical protein